MTTRMMVLTIASAMVILASMASPGPARAPGSCGTGGQPTAERACPMMRSMVTPPSGASVRSDVADDGAASSEPRERAPSAPGGAERGRRVFLARCAACHGTDPARNGPVGPAVKGATTDLVRARVLWAAYPPGYVPKRPTRIMPPQPDLAQWIADLAAFLQAR